MGARAQPKGCAFSFSSKRGGWAWTSCFCRLNM
nr:MAG TPA: hypothetical protein [Caudoviricetes sp.]